MTRAAKEIIGPKRGWNCRGKFKNGSWRQSKPKRKEYPFFFRVSKKLTWTKKENSKASKSSLLKSNRAISFRSVNSRRVYPRNKISRELLAIELKKWEPRKMKKSNVSNNSLKSRERPMMKPTNRKASNWISWETNSKRSSTLNYKILREALKTKMNSLILSWMALEKWLPSKTMKLLNCSLV